MKSVTRFLLVAGLAALASPSVLQAQNAVLPSATEKACGAACPNNPTLLVEPFLSPIQAFKNRFVDSTSTRDYQQYRTLRARGAIASGGRIFMMLGSGVAAYEPSKLFDSTEGLSLGFSGPRQEGYNIRDQEKWLVPNSYFYAETSGVWRTATVDGQDRLYDLDADDRGFIYLAYSTFGWGILRYDGSLKFVSQGQGTGFVPKAVTAVRVGSSYYALVGDGDSTVAAYDVTNPAAPGDTPVRNLRSDRGELAAPAMAKASGTDGDIVGGIDTGGRFFVQSASALIDGASPRFIGHSFSAITSDGTNFYAAKNGSISIFSPLTPGVAASYQEVSTHSLDGFNPYSIEYGEGGYLSLVGREGNGYDVRIYKMANGVPLPYTLNGYFRKFYSQAQPGHVPAPGYTNLTQALTLKQGTRTYVILSAHGLGDVYELIGGDSVRAEIATDAGTGTQNPHSSKKGQGPFYGDPVTFRATASNSSTSVVWDMGNPESGTANRKQGKTVVHQFAGLSTLAQVTAPKSVVAGSSSDPNISDIITVSLLAPTARVRLLNTEHFLAPGVSTAPIIADDSFVDASDGSVEGHYGLWTLDAIQTASAPGVPQPVGFCGAHTLSFDAHYVPYAGVVPAAVPHYVQSVTGVSYTVRPFAAAFRIASSTPNTVTFESTTRVASGVLSSAPVLTWKLLDAQGAVLLTQTGSTFSIPKSSITTGSKVGLTASVNAAAVVTPACASYLTSEATLPLVPPNPMISVVGCANVGSPCTLTATSATNADQSDWEYSWNGVPGSGNARVATPTLSEGVHSVSVTATNAVGSQTSAAVTLSLAKPACSGFPLSRNLSVQQNPPSGLSIEFFASYFGSYAFQDCDVFSWEFGDGTPASSQRRPTHTFPANGAYTVVLTITNANGVATAAASVALGPQQNPNPTPTPTPTPGACPALPSSQNTSVTMIGTSGSCNSASASCGAGEVVSFFATSFPVASFPACQVVSWNFGDGGTAVGPNVTHQFTTAGTYNVTWTVTSVNGSINGRPQAVTIVGNGGNGNPTPTPGACATAPRGYIDITWSGAQSQCASGRNCTPGEKVTLVATAFQYNFQSCDTFEWEFNDGTPKGSGKSVEHVFVGPGPFSVGLVVRNANGFITAPAVQVKFAGTGAKPSVELEGTHSTMTGTAVTFVPKLASTAGITKYEWHMGDGDIYTKTTAAAITHTFLKAGRYDVKLIVTGSFGTATSIPFSVEVLGQPARRRGSKR
ncbi:MAG TPA: PKD domain-containing protein [Thermoanaerobaculia bacterium]|nr:PKD domain-containing protein [Thermoanaerobaculia bacterium]